MINKDEVDNTTTDEMGEYLNRLLSSKLDPERTADRYITGDGSDDRHVIAVAPPERDFANTTPGIPLPAVSQVVHLASGQQFRVTVEEIW